MSFGFLYKRKEASLQIYKALKINTKKITFVFLICTFGVINTFSQAQILTKTNNMTIIKKTYCLLFCLFLVSIFTKVNAQNEFIEGYVISLKKDTLRGLIKEELTSTGFNVVYKSSATGREKKYTPELISQFYLSSGELYESNEVIVGEVALTAFLKCVIVGKVNFYSFIDARQYEHFYIKTQENGLRELKFEEGTKMIDNVMYQKKDRLYRGELLFALQGCPEVTAEIHKAEFNRSALSRIILNYHECTNQSFTVIKSAKKKWKVEVGLVVGYSLGSVNKVGESFYLKGINYGGFLNIHLPKSHNRYAVQVGYLLSREKIENEEEIRNNNRVNLIINRYSRINDNNRMAVRAGFEMGYQDGSFRSTRPFEFIFGAGYDIKVKKLRLLIGVEVKYFPVNSRIINFNVGIAY